MKSINLLIIIAFLSSCIANKSNTSTIESMNSNQISKVNEDSKESRYARYVTLAEALKSRGGLQISTNIQGETTVLVRNINTILLETEPLFVVNGIQRGRGYVTVANLDPKTIKSIDVKKGLAATNQWGSQGNSGVILIKTINY